MPGDRGTLTLTIKNVETTSTTTSVDSYTSGGATDSTTTVKTNGATIQNVRIAPAYDGNKQIKATSSYSNIGYLTAGASITLSFELIVSENISEGLYFPKINIDLEESSYEDINYPIPIRVSNGSVDLIEKNIPSKLSISGSTDITLTAINNLDSSVDGVAVVPAKIDDVEFTPKSYYIGALAAGASQEVSFSLIPKTIGEKNLSFETIFKNGNNLHNTTLIVPVEVVNTLDVAPIFTSFPYTIKKGSSTRVTLDIYNAKTESITGVIITPISNATLVPSQYFIGTMDPDDVFSTSFDLYTDTLDYGTYTIGFKVSFKQGNEYYETPLISKSFSVVSGASTSYQSTSGSNSQQSSGLPFTSSLTVCILTIVVIIIVIITAALLFLKWRKRRNVK
jgi:hypothetical protein